MNHGTVQHEIFPLTPEFPKTELLRKKFIDCFPVRPPEANFSDIDIFRRGDEYCISEVNPRFGGGYPHAYACGVNVPAMVINNLQGEKNRPCIGEYKAGMVMMKYSEIMVREGIGE